MQYSTPIPTVLHRFPQNIGAMARNRAEKAARSFVCLMGLTFVTAIAVWAANPPQSAAPRGLGFTYDPAREITLVGTVKGFVSTPAKSPVGLHLLLSSGGKVVDAHLGTFVSEENQQALHTGQLVQIIGVNENVHGRNFLLARQLIFDGRLVTVRNERGFLIRSLTSRKIHDGNPAVSGGTR